tara:strand:- start:2582 stop:2932 length:351 start_codon:yes stop_codon:yes gene_type:complete
MELDNKLIKKLLEVLEEIKKSTKGQANLVEELKDSVDDGSIKVKSPLVGTAYIAPEPGAKPFVKVGQKVKKGQTVIIVEAMKTMNQVQSTENGEIVEICVQDGEAVEYDQILVKIK